MRNITSKAALLAGLTMVAAACGGSGDRDALIEDRTRIGNTQEEAECYADAVLAEFGEDPGADGDISDEEVSTMLRFIGECVGGE